MHLLGHRTLGITILILLSQLVIVKRLATGSVLEYRPRGNLWVWLTNNFNLFFLLVVNPGAALLLIAGELEAIDPTHLAIIWPQFVTGLEIAGLSLYIMGCLLMAWALVVLGSNYQLGGSAPRKADEMVTAGPYQFARHPMYTAVLGISVGLAFLVQSLAFFLVFWIYLGLILALIPVEEERLQLAYDNQYFAYQKKVKKLIPYLY